jgi:Thioredoxin like C-terminal domain
MPTEKPLVALDRATGWINSPPLTAPRLRGSVVVIHFWTYTCINWLRSLPHVRGHENVERAARDLGVNYPIALDSDYAIWRAPRLYQLVRHRNRVDSRTVEIAFLDPGARAYVFTFG